MDDFAEEYLSLIELLTSVSEANVSLRQAVFEFAITCEELIHDCKFRDVEISCCKFFKPVFNERGFCYSFNPRFVATPNDEWVELQKINELTIIRSLLRTRNDDIAKLFESDKIRALRFFLNAPSKVYLHAQEEVTSFDILPQFIWEKQFYVDLHVSMKETFTTDDVIQLSSVQRKCFFQDEVNLNYFKSDFYSTSTCMLKCRMEKANKLCKCIPPFYAPSTGSHQECASKDELKCLKENRHNITHTKGCSHCLLSCLNTVYESDKLTQKYVKLFLHFMMLLKL